MHNDNEIGFGMMMTIDVSDDFRPSIHAEMKRRFGDMKQSDIINVEGVINDIKIDYTDHMNFDGYSDDMIAGMHEGFDVMFRGVWEEYFMKREVIDYIAERVEHIEDQHEDFRAYEIREIIEEVNEMIEDDADYIAAREVFESMQK